MGNVLNQISKDNMHFTIFKNNQVLTADQLNDLVNYLDVQTKLTRTKAIGVGIIYGLEIGLISNKNLVVSSGAAITTDGDLLVFDLDQEFDEYDVFEDLNAKYPYFLNDSEQHLPMFQLKNSGEKDAVKGKKLSSMEADTSTLMSDYVGILYLEDYFNNPDLCTGKDCDNKGGTTIKELKVLLIHKNNIGALLQSLPKANIDYFSMEDLNIPRVIVNTELDTFKELNVAFNNALSVSSDIDSKLKKAYEICKLIVDQDFPNGNPTAAWSDLLKEQFKINPTNLYAQYAYDYARDLGYAYTELKESLFVDDMLTDPEVDLFPKHVLIGAIREAKLTKPFPEITSEPLASSSPLRILLSANLLKPSILRFNFKSFTQRFNKIDREVEYRHHFYESPILNSNYDANQITRFTFMRLHCMITNFRVPTSENLRRAGAAVKVLPSLFEDVPLGKRSIPFYYNYDPTFPINLYWNFEANKRQKENQLLYYSSSKYSQTDAVNTPFNYSILRYNFFRIEGHIGFRLSDVETILNKIILDNNLPVNIISVQVEKKIETISPRPWFFPHLYLYEKSVRSTFLDRLENADLVNEDLEKDTDTTITNIPVSEFKTAKQSVEDNAAAISDENFDFLKYRAAVSNVITAASNVKAQTKQFTFSNTAIPHDFIMNSDLIRKTDVIAGIYQDTLLKKKQALMLGNFMKENPGLEHAGGVLRGGTFVLVYTGDDKIVVADFMLPYASLDKDIVINPPKYTPIPLPLPPDTSRVPRFPIRRVFEPVPSYVKKIDSKLEPYIKNTDLEEKINVRVARGIDDSLKGVNNKLDGFSTRLDDNANLFSKVFTPNKFADPKGSVTKGLGFADQLGSLSETQDKIQSLGEGTPERIAAEKQYAEGARSVIEKLSDPKIADDASNALEIGAALSKLQGGLSLIKDTSVKTDANKSLDKANLIGRKLRFDF